MIEFAADSPLSEPLIFDTHAHYEDEKFSEYGDSLFDELKSGGVSNAVTCGCNKDSCLKALALAEKHDFLYAAVGIHPCDIESGCAISDIEKMAKHKKCVAIGEIGLDYYWEPFDKLKQQEFFVNQILLAKKLGLPIIVHDRDAHADTLKILKKYKPKGVVHSFSGSIEMAEEIIKLGMYFGIGGVVTFKNAKKLPDVVKMLPEDKILLETDAPYLAPEPFRGKINNSSLIYFTAEKIAEIRGSDTETVLKFSKENAKKLFLV